MKNLTTVQLSAKFPINTTLNVPHVYSDLYKLLSFSLCVLTNKKWSVLTPAGSGALICNLGGFIRWEAAVYLYVCIPTVQQSRTLTAWLVCLTATVFSGIRACIHIAACVHIYIYVSVSVSLCVCPTGSHVRVVRWVWALHKCNETCLLLCVISTLLTHSGAHFYR